MGRPKLEEPQESITVRLPVRDMTMVRTLARDAAQTVPQWIRSYLVRQFRSMRARPAVAQQQETVSAGKGG